MNEDISKSLDKMTPGRAIRKFCLDCCYGSPAEVKKCAGNLCLNGPEEVCYLYSNRMGKGRTSVKTIRKMCMLCMSNSAQMIRECHADPDDVEDFGCALHPYRFGELREKG